MKRSQSPKSQRTGGNLKYAMSKAWQPKKPIKQLTTKTKGQTYV